MEEQVRSEPENQGKSDAEMKNEANERFKRNYEESVEN